MDTEGRRFLSENDSDLQPTGSKFGFVRHNAEQQGIKELSFEEQVASWVDIIVDRHTKHRENPEIMRRYKTYYEKMYVIKAEDVPESVFEKKKRDRWEKGCGDVEISEEERKADIDLIQANQKGTLDTLINIFTSSGLDYIPSWIRYWAFNGMLKLGRYNEDKKAFEPRMKDTVAPFPAVDFLALSVVVDMLRSKYGQEYFDLTDQIVEANIQLKEAVDLERLTRIIELVDKQGAEQTQRGRNIVVYDDKTGKEIGVGRRYLQKMRAKIQDIEAKGQGEEVLDSEKIREKIENLSSQKAKILEERGIPDEFVYTDSANEDFIKLYSYAYNQVRESKHIEKEIIAGQWVKFERGSDPRKLVVAIRGFGFDWCTEYEATAAKQLGEGDFYIYFSNDADGNPVNPRIAILLKGDKIEEIRGIEGGRQELDKQILYSGVLQEKLKEFGEEGNEYLQKEEDMKRMTVIEKKVGIGEDLTKEDIHFLYEIDRPIIGFGEGRDPRIERILSKRNVKRDLSFLFDCSEDQISVTKEEALSGGDIKYHYGDIVLSSLTSVEGLVLPERIRGNLSLSKLTSVEGLVFPKRVGGRLDLKGLTSAEGLVLPESVGILDLSGLTSAKGLVLPKRIRKSLDLSSLTSAEDLVLPDGVIGGHLHLSNLRSTRGLVLPKGVKRVYIGEYISDEELLELRNQYPDIDIRRKI